MPLKMGHSKEVVNANIHEMVKSGRPVKQAIAASLANARKYKKMAMGGMVEGDEEDESNEGSEGVGGDMGDAGSATYPRADDEQGLSDEVMDAQAENAGLQGEKYPANDNSVSYEANSKVSGMKMNKGGLAQSELAQALGNKPDLDWVNDGTGEPMGVMPNKPAELGHAMINGVPDVGGLSEEAKKAIEAKKKGRRFFQHG